MNDLIILLSFFSLVGLLILGYAYFITLLEGNIAVQMASHGYIQKIVVTTLQCEDGDWDVRDIIWVKE